MLHKTRGIVLTVTDFSESSIIAKIYTENFGLQSFLVNGVRRKKSKIKGNVFEALTILEMVIYHKENRGLQRISEVRASPVYKTIPTDILKTSVVIFLAEVLYKSIREEEANPQLFSFLQLSLVQMDAAGRVDGLFHHRFLLELTGYLGFYPDSSYSPGFFFNLREGVFESREPLHPFFMDKELSFIFHNLLQVCSGDAQPIQVRLPLRRELMRRILEYYSLHLPFFGEIRSLPVLEELFGD